MSNFCFNPSVPQHLFTCDLDGKDLKNITDCVDRLNLLEEMGHVWGQNMQLEVQGTKMMLTDIENKVTTTAQLTKSLFKLEWVNWMSYH